LLRLKEMEVDMWGAGNDEAEMSFRRGYQQGVIDVFLRHNVAANRELRGKRDG